MTSWFCVCTAAPRPSRRGAGLCYRRRAMTKSFNRALAVFTLLLPACDDAAAPLAAYTPDHAGAHDDPVAGMALRVDPPEIELADGEVVALALADEQRASLECDGDERVSQLSIDPLRLGERSFAAPVLEVTCDGERAQPWLRLRDAGEPCTGANCIAFTPTAGLDGDLPLRAPEPPPVGVCDWAGTTVCVPCGGIGMRTRTTIVTNYDPYTNKCTYGYSYGGCSPTAC